MEFQTNTSILPSSEVQSVKHKSVNSTNVSSVLPRNISKFFWRILISWHLHVRMYSWRHETLTLKFLKTLASNWVQYFLFNITRTQFMLGIVRWTRSIFYNYSYIRVGEVKKISKVIHRQIRSIIRKSGCFKMLFIVFHRSQVRWALSVGTYLFLFSLFFILSRGFFQMSFLLGNSPGKE